MNMESNTAIELPNNSSVALRATPTFYWSVKRELWENKSIYIAPLIVAAVILFGALIGAGQLPERRRAAMLLDEVHRRAAIELPYDIVAMMLMVTAGVVGLFYCLDALYGERRERSILFWKSLPVSDRTTVLAKLSIPLLVIPPVMFAIVILTQFVMLLISSAVLLPAGLASTSWANFNIPQQSAILIYSLIVITLWHAPIYGWALLVSGVARRATFLWAVLPPFAVAIFEKITFNTTHVWGLLKNRLLGAGDTAFDFQSLSQSGTHRTILIDSLSQLTVGRFLATPGLWLGLIFAAAFVIATIQLRRYRGPL